MLVDKYCFQIFQLSGYMTQEFLKRCMDDE